MTPDDIAALRAWAIAHDAAGYVQARQVLELLDERDQLIQLTSTPAASSATAPQP